MIGIITMIGVTNLITVSAPSDQISELKKE